MRYFDKTRGLHLAAAVVLALLAFAGRSLAQGGAYTLVPSVVGSGGGSQQSGAYTLVSTVGQPVTNTGGNRANGYTLLSGFLQPADFAPTAVTLASFTASAAASGVHVAWQTAAEVDTVGFNVWRTTTDNWQKVNPALIPARGIGGAGGSDYGFVDRDISVVGGQSSVVFYKLEMVGADGRAAWAGPVMVTVTRPAAREPRR